VSVVVVIYVQTAETVMTAAQAHARYVGTIVLIAAALIYAEHATAVLTADITGTLNARNVVKNFYRS